MAQRGSNDTLLSRTQYASLPPATKGLDKASKLLKSSSNNSSRNASNTSISSSRTPSPLSERVQTSQTTAKSKLRYGVSNLSDAEDIEISEDLDYEDDFEQDNDGDDQDKDLKLFLKNLSSPSAMKLTKQPSANSFDSVSSKKVSSPYVKSVSSSWDDDFAIAPTKQTVPLKQQTNERSSPQPWKTLSVVQSPSPQLQDSSAKPKIRVTDTLTNTSFTEDSRSSVTSHFSAKKSSNVSEAREDTEEIEEIEEIEEVESIPEEDITESRNSIDDAESVEEVEYEDDFNESIIEESQVQSELSNSRENDFSQVEESSIDSESDIHSGYSKPAATSNNTNGKSANVKDLSLSATARYLKAGSPAAAGLHANLADSFSGASSGASTPKFVEIFGNLKALDEDKRVHQVRTQTVTQNVEGQKVQSLKSPYIEGHVDAMSEESVAKSTQVNEKVATPRQTPSPMPQPETKDQAHAGTPTQPKEQQQQQQQQYQPHPQQFYVPPMPYGFPMPGQQIPFSPQQNYQQQQPYSVPQYIPIPVFLPAPPQSQLQQLQQHQPSSSSNIPPYFFGTIMPYSGIQAAEDFEKKLLDHLLPKESLLYGTLEKEKRSKKKSKKSEKEEKQFKTETQPYNEGYEADFESLRSLELDESIIEEDIEGGNEKIEIGKSAPRGNKETGKGSNKVQANAEDAENVSPLVREGILDQDTYSLLSSRHPNAKLLNSMLHKHLLLVENALDQCKKVRKDLLETATGSKKFKYTTLEDTKAYIAKRKKPIISYQEALKLAREGLL